ncbi:MAG: non-canonical purine NTP pyrophosphatase [bacterium]|nr:non-canonical purine NTP pyrophosphatase [bacterium]
MRDILRPRSISYGMKKILIATKNPGKIQEYMELLKGEPFEFVTLNDIKITMSIDEDGETMEENAVKKAVHYAYFSNLPALADDGGIEIEALNGEPGVKTRRWPGYEATDEELVDMALEKMKGVPWEKRKARFRVLVAFAIPNEENVWVREGVKEGYITETATPIVRGYPFRSIFWFPETKKMWAEHTPEEEDKLVLHRKQAVEQLLPIIKKELEKE